jgi:hypothetical protein
MQEASAAGPRVLVNPELITRQSAAPPS